MAIKADIWMPLYIGDYLADTAYLTTEQHGAYLLLIMAYWRNGPPPDNDAILASLTKMTPDAWSIARAVLGRYFIVGGGVWIHARIEREIEKAKKHRESAHEKAARAAAARWEKERERKMLGALPEALHGEMPQQCPSPSPSPLPKQSQVQVQKKGKIKTLGDLTIADSEAFDAFWSAYPRKKNRAAAIKAFRHVGPGLLPTVFADIEARIRAGDWRLDQPEYIPHPATYLNGNRWLDEITPRGQQNETSRSVDYDKPRSPGERFAARIAARDAQRESNGSALDGHAQHFRPPVREQLREISDGRVGDDTGRHNSYDDRRGDRADEVGGQISGVAAERSGIPRPVPAD